MPLASEEHRPGGAEVWYLTTTGQKSKGRLAERFGWGGQTYIVIATGTKWDTDFVVRLADLVAYNREDRIGFGSDDDALSAEIGDIVLPSRR